MDAKKCDVCGGLYEDWDHDDYQTGIYCKFPEHLASVQAEVRLDVRVHRRHSASNRPEVDVCRPCFAKGVRYQLKRETDG